MKTTTPLTEDEASRFPRTLVVYATVGILSTGLLLAALDVAPLYRLLVQEQNQHLVSQINSLSETVQQYLNRIVDISLQVTSRTKAREKLEAYNNGEIESAELREFSIPILADALKRNDSILGIARLDAKGNVAVETGAAVTSAPWSIQPHDVRQATIEGPIQTADGQIIIVYAPILDRNLRIVGVDVVAFDFAELRQILNDYATNNPAHELYLSKSGDNKIEKLFGPGRETHTNTPQSATDNAILYARKHALPDRVSIVDSRQSAAVTGTVAYRLLTNVDWLLSVHVENDALYRPIYREVATYFGALVLIALLGSILTYLCLRPLSKKLASLTAHLRKEITERQQAERALSVRVIQQATVAELGRLALSGIAISSLLYEAAKRTAVVLNVEYCKLLELAPDKQSFLLRSGVGWKEGLVGRAVVSAGPDSQAGYTLRSSEPVVVEDLRTEQRFCGPSLLVEHGVVSGMSVIVGHNEPWGVFGVYSAEKRAFTQDDINFLLAIANCIAEAIQRKKAEQTLQTGEERYRALYNDNPSMLFTVDQQGTILSVNHSGAEQLGYTADELIGRPVANIFYEADRDAAGKFLDGCLADSESVHRWELRKTRKDGSIVWVREAARLIYDDAHNPQVLVVCEDISEARRLSEQLSYHASHDPLTGLANRREFEQRLITIIEAAREEKSEHALCYLDLDQFKVINDTYGHFAGDQLLRQLSGLLSRRVRKRDTLARLGGDEFGILMEHCSLDQAEQVAATILKEIEGFRFVWEGRSFIIGVSIGLVPILATSVNATEVMRQADTACYAAKDGGRNRVHVYQKDDSELTRRHGEMQWVAEINQALDENRFVLYVQPIVPIGPAENDGQYFEVLLRMQTEKGEIIPPGAFLPAAERYNLAARLDKWVVGTLFDYLKKEPELQNALGVCSINLSGQSIADADFLSYIIAELERGLAADRICFEITETAAIADLTRALEFMQQLKALGCRFALDDFGSGLSSFAYLKNMPVDYLKIDGMFVKTMIEDAADAAMVKSIHEVGKALGKKTIAEFVENDAIKEKLKAIGVDYAQGYGISRPYALSEIVSTSDRQSVKIS